MAGSEQRPTEDVEGHRYRNLDTEAIDEDQVADDTKGHMPFSRRPGQDTEAVDEDQAGDDTEGHGRTL